MDCWTELDSYGAHVLDIAGGPSSRIYAMKDNGDISVYSALDGSLITAGYMAWTGSGSGFGGTAAVPDTDPTTLYYNDFDPGTFAPQLRKTVAGGSDSLVGDTLYGAAPISIRRMVWLPGTGLIGFGFEDSFPITNRGIYAVDETDGSLALLVTYTAAAPAPSAGMAMVTSDDVLWWSQFGPSPDFHYELHAWDGSHHVLDLFPETLQGFLTFNPADPTQVLIDMGSGFGPDYRYFALSGGSISQVGTSPCTDQLSNDGAWPLWTWDYTAADNWGNSGSQVWRWMPVATEDWHVGAVYG